MHIPRIGRGENTNKKKLILVIAVLVFGVVSIVAGIGTMTNAGGGGVKYEKYSSAEYGFSVNYPQNWIERTGSGAAVYYNAPPLKLTSTSSWNDPASFNVQIPAPAGGKTLNQLVDESKLAVENMFPGISFTNEKDVQVNGIKGHEWMVVVDNFSGSGVNATMMEDFFIANDKVYVITFMAISEYYGDYAGTFDAILNSFTVP